MHCNTYAMTSVKFIWIAQHNWNIGECEQHFHSLNELDYIVNFSIFFINLMFLYIFKIIIKLIITSSRFDPSSTSKPLNLSLLRFNEQSGSENLGFTHRPKLQSKSPFSQSKISQFQSLGVEIWVQRNLPSLPHDLPQFPPPGDCGSKFQTCWTTFFPLSKNLRAKTHWARKYWKYGYRGTFPLFLTISLNFLLRVIVGRSFRPVIFLYFFYTFVSSILILSCQRTISLCFLYIVNVGLDSPPINTSKEPKGRFRVCLDRTYFAETENLLLKLL